MPEKHRAWDDPTHHPKWHPDPFSHFATVHFLDRQTNRRTNTQTDRGARQQVRIMSAALAMPIESDALIMLMTY